MLDNENLTGRRTCPADLIIARRLRALRIERGLSQQALADKLGVTFQQIQKYEHGTNRISAGRLAYVAAALGVSAGYFYRDLAA